MTTIILDITKTIDENAADYFEAAKKARRKIKGIDKALAVFSQQRDDVLKKQDTTRRESSARVEPRTPTHWYEKFRWFTSSEGALCIGGRDATQNEVLIKKHVDASDVIFHTDIPGSPFFIVKAQGNTITEATYAETAQATLSYSKAWKLGVTSAEVFRVTPDQVSKQAESGEYLSKGSFMIRGKRTYYRPSLGLAIGLHDNNIIGGPPPAISAHTKNHVHITLDTLKPSEAAQKIKKQLKYAGHVDDIIRFLPAGKVGVKKTP